MHEINNVRSKTNLILNTESNISVLLKSNIGPKTRKVSNELDVNEVWNEEATNASDVEQMERIYAKPIMKK